MNEFELWSELKQELDALDKAPPYREGQVWWAAFGINIGAEIRGKGSGRYERPVIVLQRFSQNMCLVLPLTTQEKTGSWFHSIHHAGRKQTVVLNQVRAISPKRFLNQMGELRSDTFEGVKEAFERLMR